MNLIALLTLLPLSFSSISPEMLPPTLPTPVHGIYLTSQTVGGGKNLDSLLDEFSKLGGNMVVFDVQDSNGKFAYLSNVPTSIEIGNRKDQIKNLSATVKKLHDKGFYAVARLVMFKNGFLAARKPEWTLKSKWSKSTFVSRDGPIWLNPGNPELKEYLLDIGRELAFAGVDEIQFDYVRFPEGGKGGNVGYTFTGDGSLTRDEVLTNAVAEIAGNLQFLNVKIGMDIFGIVVWDNVSWKVIGQNIRELAKYVDVLYPMPYPSHFGPGWGGHANPADEPYFFVQETTKKFVEQTAGTGVKIRPWLQGFAMRVTNYGGWYVQDQIRALNDLGLDEFVVWNAANNYAVTFSGLR